MKLFLREEMILKRSLKTTWKYFRTVLPITNFQPDYINLLIYKLTPNSKLLILFTLFSLNIFHIFL